MAKEILVLVADDEPANLNLLKDIILEMSGYYAVLTADNGEEAVRVYQTNPGIRLAILDWKMPKMTGSEVHDFICRNNSELPIIFCSGWSPEGEMDKLLAQGNNYFIPKPFSLQTMKELIEKLCPNET